jgi:predicted nucleic acid-binding protein
MSKFIESATLVPLTEAIANTTIGLRRDYKIKLPDAIIAATCVSGNSSLVTRNVSAFRKISNLRVIDAHQK